ncbi:MAG: alanine racemase [Proteobacteria bacterium]|nr:alanine racemase [Pseudomonadota bacterium]
MRTDPRSQVPSMLTTDPWVEVIAGALENNVRELYRYTQRRLLAVVKNNANGVGIRQVGPILDAMPEVFGLAVVRVAEALALRESGVTKPILIMAHVTPDEAEQLVLEDVRLTPFHDDSITWLTALANRLSKPVPVHLFVDTGMNRIGLPYDRATPWISELVSSGAVAVEGTYTMFSGAERSGEPFDQEQLRRFDKVVDECREAGIDLGLLHGAPSYQVVHLPQAWDLDLIRPGGAIYGMPSYRSDASGNHIMDLQPVYRLRARIVRVELLAQGEGVSFHHRYRADVPTWIATVPVGHTDGYPRNAPGNTTVLVGETFYPVIAEVSSNHTIIEVGPHKTLEVGDIATLVGPDHDQITPETVARSSGLERDYWLTTKLNPLLTRVVV